MEIEQQACERAEFAGKRVLVTGGTKGIGAATVNRPALSGATVLTTARSLPTGGYSDQLIQANVSTRDELKESSRPPSTGSGVLTYS